MQVYAFNEKIHHFIRNSKVVFSRKDKNEPSLGPNLNMKILDKVLRVKSFVYPTYSVKLANTLPTLFFAVDNEKLP